MVPRNNGTVVRRIPGELGMSLKVIGAGLGRTGTYSLKLALEALGLGPCFHMESVMHDQPKQVPLWNAAYAGRPNWPAIFQGFSSAVDWPTATYFRELHAAYPDAKFVLTHRSVEGWVESYSQTILAGLSARDTMPADKHAWLDMVIAVTARAGFPLGLDAASLARAFEAHAAAVKAAIPADRLLIYQVKEGWGPLCAFLGLAEPAEPFPRSNDREEFFARFRKK
jgi:hypothetical protein